MGHSLEQIGAGADRGGSARARSPSPTVEQVLKGVRPSFEGAYVHVPFCFHKCHYCDFYSFVDQENRQGAFVDRLEAELVAAADLMRAPLRTLFVGGGTPTLLEPVQLERMLRAVARVLPLAPDVEWTVEANPETVTAEVAGVLAACGVNRVSMGAQSFHPHLLKALERWHDPANVGRAVDLVRAAGIRRVNVDLIFGIPGSTVEEWAADVARVLELTPSHVSCYGLTYEPNTALTRKLAKGDVVRCAEDVEAAMYESTRVQLGAAGFQHYEISNWALRGEECRHNLLYWRNRDWMAFGPSASGHAQGVRWKNVPRLGDWLSVGPWSPAEDVERVDDDARVGERLMMGLRLREGVAAEELRTLLAMGTRGAERARAIADARRDGLLEDEEGALRLTPRGQLLADSVLCRLI